MVAEAEVVVAAELYSAADGAVAAGTSVSNTIADDLMSPVATLADEERGRDDDALSIFSADDSEVKLIFLDAVVGILADDGAIDITGDTAVGAAKGVCTFPS